VEWIVVLPVLRDAPPSSVGKIVHLRAFTQGQGSISDCQEKLDFYTIFRGLAG
jgi:hypothetical protein